MIKRIYRCDPVQWGALFYLILLVLVVGNAWKGSPYGIEYNLFDLNGVSESENWLQYAMNGALLLIIPILFRRGIKESGGLGFSERVSYYPIGLFTVTALLSANTTPLLISVLCITLLLNRILSLAEGDNLSRASFDSGVIVSIGCLFSNYFIFEMVFVWLALSIIRPPDWKSIVWSLIGLVALPYLYFSLKYIIVGEVVIRNDIFQMIPEYETSLRSGAGIWSILYLVITISMFLLMLARSMQSAHGGVVRRRKVIRIGIALLIVNLIISAVLFQFQGVSPFSSILAVPLAILYLELMEGERPIVHQVLFMLWLILTFIICWN